MRAIYLRTRMGRSAAVGVGRRWDECYVPRQIMTTRSPTVKQLVARGSQAGGVAVLFFYAQSALARGRDSAQVHSRGSRRSSPFIIENVDSVRTRTEDMGAWRQLVSCQKFTQRKQFPFQIGSLDIIQGANICPTLVRSHRED